ncbi:hypothetical protein COE79_25550 [Bacillus toyonensis]|uniref:hypothetical protein n=1 Tax=Bacillus toyonensis TaxID=155322 RepID=UPI000279DBB1|nr:hypothetical protein IIO_03007 [Bacillus cereus VD115]EJV46189.1 hypothetical protein IEA_03424 [Bacillus toyonensis]KAB0448941.1 hypothetical protein CH334_11175 [Lysinibacillus sp. VIA-II-2016]EJV93696.1 hypothetical protein IGI_03414 [Bacillus toyonensis]EOP43381.1 hypothetical protein IKI_01271 [Bacillus toyonensis]
MIYTKSFTLELLAEMKYLGKPIAEVGLQRDRPRLYNAIRCYFDSLEDAISQVTPIPIQTYKWS